MKLIIFDLDETIINSAKNISKAINKALQKHHQPKVTLEEVTRNLGNGRNL